MSDNIFLDGQTRSARIAAVPNLHGEFTFEFRPLPWADVQEFSRAAATAAKAKWALYHALVAKHLVSWSADGKPSIEMVAKLHPAIFERVFSIIVGRDGGDGPSTDQSDQYSDFARSLLEGADSEEAIVKN